MNRTVAKRTAAVCAAAVMPVTMLVSAAWAGTPTCSAGKYVLAQDGLDPNRAYATCSYIDSVTRVRAKLNRNNQTDINGSWFTTRNVTYYTAYATCPFGCSGGYECAPR